MYVPPHKFFGLLVLQLHQPSLLEKCAQDDVAHVLKDDVKGYLPDYRTRQN